MAKVIAGWQQLRIFAVIPLPLPTTLPLFRLGRFTISRKELRSRLGFPHNVETDSTRTFGGEEDCWGFTSTTGQRLIVLLHVPVRMAEIIADPPNMEMALEALEEVIGDIPVERYDKPYSVK